MPNTGSANIIGPVPGRWAPVVGTELIRLLDSKFSAEDPSYALVRDSTVRILEQCVDPTSADAPSSTGLVVGYVQSGKTLSFTAVAAAAQDNGFRTIVVIAGSSLNLADQNKDRLAKDLNVDENFARPWLRRHNPTVDQLDELRTGLNSWNNGRGTTLLLTSLKHYRHIQNLGAVLEALGDSAAPILIIDDEADQISLNTRVRQNDESANYTQILGLRDKASRHTYLQYTATPQANIFIPLWDLLSPSFCEPLSPGAGYVGGHHMFIDRPADYVRVISDSDLQVADDLSAVPDSLYEAMRVFFLGAANGLAEYHDAGEVPDPPNRSMMVHPSRLQQSHLTFYGWIQTTKTSWANLLKDPNDPDYQTLVDEFRNSYTDLVSSNHSNSLRSFDDLLSILPQCVEQTQIREVNARTPGRIDWSSEWSKAYSWILVGGVNLDRGFTVEGLTVTYMPRDIGVGQADTVQQRARFFGYKQGYADFCRVYLGPDANKAFTVYVRHERSMRGFLERHKYQLDNPSIPREFELDPQLRPTRTQVLLQNPRRFMFRSGWCEQRSPVVGIDRCRRNAMLVDSFSAQHGQFLEHSNPPWVADDSMIRDDHRHHVITDIPLNDLYTGLLADIVLPDTEDYAKWQAALAMIASAIEEHSDLRSSIVKMRPASDPFRGMDSDDRIKQVFAGAYPGSRPYAYAGDRDVSLNDVTLQVHIFNLGDGTDSETSTQRTISHSSVPILTLWLGDRVERPMIRQDQT